MGMCFAEMFSTTFPVLCTALSQTATFLWRAARRGLGAGFIGSWLNAFTRYEKPLDALGAVILSALCIKILTFLNNQDLNTLFGFFSRLRGGGGNGN